METDATSSSPELHPPSSGGRNPARPSSGRATEPSPRRSPELNTPEAAALFVSGIIVGGHPRLWAPGGRDGSQVTLGEVVGCGAEICSWLTQAREERSVGYGPALTLAFAPQRDHL
ncbi:PREDICTED: protein CROC-4 isoform X9 [Hipposideros armiger]|uniref:Protein CROC-4 isoform X9 n=1 Tax=Hipposideros armiger TaxID=186990 RepID=A0A8B7T209_HIPAR|nr:PREDICTED: protein CROC-4 isoform X9 [Hipposideros armiger]